MGLDGFGVTPYGIAVALSAAAALLLLTGQRRKAERTENMATQIQPLELALWCVPSAFICARLLYCLVRFDFYFIEMGPLSVLRTWEGGFLLYGAVFGALAAAAWLASWRNVSVPATLDELAAPGLLSIAICRLFEGTVGEGVGNWVENPALCRFPIAVSNEYGEWQLAIFVLEAIVAVVLLFAVWRYRGAPGEKVMTALLLYACCQILLESLRMDGCLKIGFVRISQVLSGITVLGVTMIRAGRMKGMRHALCRGLVIGVCAAIVGGLEWALDKTSVPNLILYMVMAADCAAMAVCGMTAGKRAAHARA